MFEGITVAARKPIAAQLRAQQQLQNANYALIAHLLQRQVAKPPLRAQAHYEELVADWCGHVAFEE